MSEFLLWYGAAAVLLFGPLVVVLWDVLVTEPRLKRGEGGRQ
jgi:hypothetical protein